MPKLINLNKNIVKLNKLNEKIQELYILCFPNVSEPPEKSYKLSKLLHTLLNIINISNGIQLKYFGLQEILPCSIKILLLCDQDIRSSFNTSKLQHSKNYNTAKNCYNYLLNIFIPEKSNEIMKIIIDIINQEHIWQLHNFCYDIIIGYLQYNGKEADVVNYLLDIVQSEHTHTEDARAILQILTDIFNKYSYSNTAEAVSIINRLIKLYRNNINVNANSRNGILNSALEVFIHNTIDELPNNNLIIIIYKLCSEIINTSLSDKFIQELGKILEYATCVYKTNLLEDTFTEELLNIITQMISSSNPLISLYGNRIFQHLIDRNKNKKQFESPAIFYENIQYNIKPNQCVKEDVEFLKRNRELIHDTLVESIIKNSSRKLNLESSYCTICVLALEVPSGFTAAALVCIVMNIQKLTLQGTVNCEVSYHIHATIIAILTLICWIHDAKVLYSYVNKIIMKRAQWAPQLNPPLKTKYVFAVHYVVWNKPDLYFVDWEARFGLWKCFRSHYDKK